MLLPSIIGAIVPMLIYLYFLWRFDKNEPEPIKLVLYHFLYGATISVVLGIIGSKILSFPLTILFDEKTNSLLAAILIAPFVEEIAKASILFRTIKNKNIDNLTDGLIYGGAIGLGFGMTENFLYFILYGNTPESFLTLFIIRSGFSAVMHSLATATIGGLMSITKYSSKTKSTAATLLGLMIAMFIHFVWNLSVSFSETVFIGILFILTSIAIFVLTYYLSLKYENKIIAKELTNEIPSELIAVLTSPLKFRKDWFEKSLKNRFIQKTTLLAFRKHQVEISDKNRELYNNEIEQLRTEIAELIKINNNE